MSKLMKLAGAMLAVVIAGPAFAVDLTPVPVIPGLVPAAPAPEVVLLDEAPEELFECVKYVYKHATSSISVVESCWPSVAAPRRTCSPSTRQVVMNLPAISD